jgi:hypothetical protein
MIRPAAEIALPYHSSIQTKIPGSVVEQNLSTRYNQIPVEKGQLLN